LGQPSETKLTFGTRKSFIVLRSRCCAAELTAGPPICKAREHRRCRRCRSHPSWSGARPKGFGMKAVIYPFRKDDAIVQLARDFPKLDWAIVSSTDELAREIGEASILVTSNRVCTPAYGQALAQNARRLQWMFFSSSGVERGLAAGIPPGVRVSNSTG